MATARACPAPMTATSNGSWDGDNPLHHSLPLIILQICLVLVVTRSLAFLLRPLRQPRVIAEIIGGILLGPSALGRSKRFMDNVFPKQGMVALETMANVGLLFFLFLVGLELDLRSIRRISKGALAIAIAGITLPFALGIGTAVVLRHTIVVGARQGPFLVFMGVALSITAFPVLARILAELKLLTTDLGRMAMSAAAVNDVVARILLALALALSGSGSPLISLWVLLTSIGFIACVAFFLRPALAWVARRSLEGEPVKESYVCAILAVVLAASFANDVIGIHALFGAFMVGVVVPKDEPFAGVIIEKVEDLVFGLFLPLYFVSSGLKTNIATIRGSRSWGLLVLVITNACLGKIGGTVIASLIVKIPIREAVTLGFLMNTKGVIELIVLNIGKDRKVLDDETFTIMVLMALFTTFITTPIVKGIYKPARRAARYQHRTVERSDMDSKLRVLACFHGVRNIPTMINLVEISRGIRHRRLTVYALHLMELSERSSAISMVHKAHRNGLPFWDRRDNTDHMVVAFEAYRQLSAVAIRPMTAISVLDTIHEDIVASALQKRAALILLPFHKTQQLDGTLESVGHAYHLINQRVLRHAPCSVAILVDRGLGGAAQVSSSEVSYTVVVLFFGGPDDREALSYGALMAEHPGISLTVLRFLPPPAENLNQSVEDEACISKFRSNSRPSDGFLGYEESPAADMAGIIAAIKNLGRHNLFLVGRSPPAVALVEKSDCPELGPVGSYLASAEFSTIASGGERKKRVRGDSGAVSIIKSGVGEKAPRLWLPLTPLTVSLVVPWFGRWEDDENRASPERKIAMATASVCPAPMTATSNGSWDGDNPLHHSLPLIILQICLVLVVTRSLAFLLRPLRQPRVIAEIIGGILLGPSALGRSKRFMDNVFPKQGMTVLDTIANIGLLFFLFLVGLELDLRSIRRTGKGALAIAIAGITLPFVLGIGTSVVLRHTIVKGAHQGPFLVFMGVALSITAFPVLARILAELKLLTTDVGRMAMSAAAVNDVAAWILLALAIALSGSGSPLISLWVLLTGIGFAACVAIFLRPVLAWMARRSLEGEPVKESYVCATLAIVLAAGFATDAIGIHALFGAFMVGVVVPKDGPFAGVISEKVEDLVSGLFLPLYFVSSGLKTNVATIRGARSWGLLVLVITNACLGKIAGTIIASLVAKIPIREAFTLGFLMNTKGLVELIVLNIGKDRKVLNDETFAIMVLMALFTTFITTPIVMGIYKPAGRAAPYKHRTIERSDKNSELRVLACFHGLRNVPTMINLAEISRGIRHRRLTLYAMHLMELSERSSAISMVHKARRNGLPFWNRRDNTDHMVVAFEAYRQLSAVAILPMTAISDLDTMHEDIVASALQKRAALILLPFHKMQQLDGTLESVGHAYHLINQRVLRHAPCSVAILVDRGLGGAAQVSSSEVSYTVVVLFFGGPDDREALSYGALMAEHPGISLTVLRFLPALAENLNQSVEDEACISKFRANLQPSDGFLGYEESAAADMDGIIAAIKNLGRHNLFVVGRSPPAVALVEKSDCPELGPVGSYLASAEFSTTASVLIIQRYDPSGETSRLVEEC
ncbi:Sodium/hydrogen exchanger family [Musa troglodytarum]|uniref:Sodium/hydrogen exchanger family n=1 Tax=Musa troglodytarum TaxID=320322 RepID=A0A9E7G2P4_9LILI|nr:Sodium/hydrogen exchanger family [Musa troglodytarum]